MTDNEVNDRLAEMQVALEWIIDNDTVWTDRSFAHQVGAPIVEDNGDSRVRVLGICARRAKECLRK